MTRITFSVAVLFAATAFAPAPFPKGQRGGGEISLAALQGRWQLLEIMLVLPSGKRHRIKTIDSEVVVEGNKWRFSDDWELMQRRKVAPGPTSPPIVINNKRRPATFDFLHPKGQDTTYGPGIIRQKGDRVEIVFATDGGPRPRSFEKPSDEVIVVTLKRLP